MVDLRTLFDASLLDHTLLGARVERWLLLVGTVLAATVVLMLLRRGLSHLIGRYAEDTSTYVDNVIAALLGKTRGYFLFTAALYGAAFFLGWSERGMRLGEWLLVLALVLQVGGWANAFLTLWTDRYRERHMEENAASVTTVQALVFLGRVALWVVVGLVVLDHFGVEVTALVAGLGGGGIAIGLAMQNVLSDLFASLSIVFDKPFVLGDMLDVDGLRGTVEHIGLKSTRVRSADRFRQQRPALQSCAEFAARKDQARRLHRGPCLPDAAGAPARRARHRRDYHAGNRGRALRVGALHRVR
jgi:hypothetical protein